MKPLLRSFSMFVRQIFKDSMLAAVCAATVLTAFFIRFGIPETENLLCGYFGKEAILKDYYLLFDLLLALITPYMLCFASAMMMLTEYDENMTGYLAVTPVGKRGYILSRLVFPAGIAFAVSIIIMKWFSLTVWSNGMILLASLMTCIASVAVAMLLFAFSHNRVEGMAVGKLSGLLMLGLPVPFFLPANVQYLFSPLPSFWIAKLCMMQNIIFLLPALVSSLIWIWFLYRKFNRKIA
ncbi:MAG: ABC transporter permease [Clostridiaceae bacterium]|nr:ABC transporter permease [Clostridiaceae bacterium]